MARRNQSSSEGGLSLVVMAVFFVFSFIVVLLTFALKLAITVAFFAAPLTIIAGYYASRRISAHPPEPPNPEIFDRPREEALISRLLSKKDWWSKFHRERYEIGASEGLYLTQKSEETRFRASRRGNELNENLQTAEDALQGIDAGIGELRSAVYETLPDWHKSFDDWAIAQSAILAWKASVLCLLPAIIVFYLFGALTNDNVGGLQSLLLWNPASSIPLGPLVSAVLISYVVGGAALFYYRKKLRSSLWGSEADRIWSGLLHKWNSFSDVDAYFAPDNSTSASEEDLERDKATSAPFPEFENEPWHRVLGVSANASADEIKAAYRNRIKDYHPDSVAGRGQKIRDVAEAESRKINIAYDQAKAAAGFG